MNSNPLSDWERIACIIRHYDFPTVSALARHIGLGRGENLYQIKRGNNHISRELADRLASRFPEVSKAWILTGEGKMFQGEIQNTISSQVTGLPFYPDFPYNRPPCEPDRILYYSRELVHNVDFAALCNTDELLPLYRKNTVLFMRRWSLKDPVLFGEAYFIKTRYCGVFRIVRKAPIPGEICLDSPNRKHYDKMIIPMGDIEELYIIV